MAYCTLTVQKGSKNENQVCLFQGLAMLVNYCQIVRNSPIGKKKSVSNIILRNVIGPTDSIFDCSPGFYERKNRRIPLFENRLELSQERAKLLNILRVVWANPVDQKCCLEPVVCGAGEPCP